MSTFLFDFTSCPRSEEFSSTDKDVFSGEVIHRRFFIYQNESQGHACNQQD
ncbi:hypothetical protein C4K13_0742 [Pseudomonas chlororaphis subsp. aureofaciens]|nr:hypothetical protein C4K13_0742 [Pseudomonas chlororaphis subsp. aureofaciens]AZD96635.1 hypothetical protein C4K12_0742 [Pseudomonas chlororaphis subsp. aureofaciens]